MEKRVVVDLNPGVIGAGLVVAWRSAAAAGLGIGPCSSIRPRRDLLHQRGH